jgi:hypothetical protein
LIVFLNNACVTHIEQEVQQSPHEIRLREVKQARKSLDNELNDAKFNPTSPLNVIARLNLLVANGGAGESLEQADPKRVVTIVEGIHLLAQFAYAVHTFDHLKGILESKQQDTVYLNITECDEEEKVAEVVGNIIYAGAETTEALIEDGKRKGIEKALGLMSCGTKLGFYDKGNINKLADEDFINGGSEYRLSTKFEGVDVSYFYPEEEQIPSISLVIDPL